MVLSVEELRKYLTTEETDEMLEAKLEAMERVVKLYTNNNFKRHLTDTGEYPMDVKMGVVNLMKWELERRDKVGVASESISRHSVTFFDMSEGNSAMGFPVALLGFLKPYKRVRFGGGVIV